MQINKQNTILSERNQIGQISHGFPGSSVVKNPPANAGDASSIPRSGRSPGKRYGNPLQYSCLGGRSQFKSCEQRLKILKVLDEVFSETGKLFLCS